MSTLSNFSDKDLKEELERREKMTKNRPEPLENPDWDKIINFVENTVNEVVKGKWHEDNDDEHYLWEEVMTAVYGDDFFKWWNKNAYNY